MKRMNNWFLGTDPGEKEKTDWAIKLYGVIVFFYGVALVVQFFSAWIGTFDDATPTDVLWDMFENIIPLFYIPTLLLFFFKCRVFPAFLALAYAYDIGVHTWFFRGYTLLEFASGYPVFITVSAVLLLTGIFYKGFRKNFRWVRQIIKDIRLEKGKPANRFADPSENGEDGHK
jgi:hypothetical protein